jgi:hypothetical protein
MGAAKGSRPDSKVVSVYITADLWADLRRHAFENDTSASALIVAKIEEHLKASPAEQAATIGRAKDITLGRRRRSS